MIGGVAGYRQQQELRAELQAHHNADGGGAVVRQPDQDDPVLRRPLHP